MFQYTLYIYVQVPMRNILLLPIAIFVVNFHFHPYF